MDFEQESDVVNQEYEYIKEDTDTILIDLVKNFPQLYDKSSTDYKNIHKKDRAWMKISSILKIPGNFFIIVSYLYIYINFLYIFLTLHIS